MSKCICAGICLAFQNMSKLKSEMIQMNIRGSYYKGV